MLNAVLENQQQTEITGIDVKLFEYVCTGNH
jgi:hypothetical protein